MKSAVALAGLIAAGCSAPASGPLAQPTVAQVLANCDIYLGKAVRVAGYLGKCEGYDCMLFADRAGDAAWHSYIEDITRSRTSRAAVPEPRVFMGVGFKDEAWDRKAAPFQQSYVVVTGRMDASSCDGVGGIDRSPGINPTDIRTWTPEEGAPAKMN